MADNEHNEAVIGSAIENAHGKPVTFLYLGHAITKPARKTFGKAEHLAQKAKIARRFMYRLQEPRTIERIWQEVHPHDLVVSPENTSLLEEINPDRIRYEETPEGTVAHLLKNW